MAVSLSIEWIYVEEHLYARQLHYFSLMCDFSSEERTQMTKYFIITAIKIMLLKNLFDSTRNTAMYLVN